MTNKTEILKDLASRKLNITRAFNAPVEKVWKAWTDAKLLDQWWAPKPWRTETKSMDFSVGGLWLYCMAGPEGEKHWCRVDFTAVTPGRSFAANSYFCDEEGNINSSFPTMHWLNIFEASATGTTLNATISFDNDADMEAIIKMGFEGGFTMGLGNLDELLEA
jgi:uncharacterized protein YndB with AHSA1/START domain